MTRVAFLKHYPTAVIALILLGIVASAQAVPTVQNYGPFQITFYHSGDSDGDTTSGLNWTAQQMADVASSVTVWDNPIANTPGRQINMHMFWDEMDSLGTSVQAGA